MGDARFPGGGSGSRRAASLTRTARAMWSFLSYLMMGRAFHGILDGSYGFMIPSINSERTPVFSSHRRVAIGVGK